MTFWILLIGSFSAIVVLAGLAVSVNRDTKLLDPNGKRSGS